MPSKKVHKPESNLNQNYLEGINASLIVPNNGDALIGSNTALLSEQFHGNSFANGLLTSPTNGSMVTSIGINRTLNETVQVNTSPYPLLSSQQDVLLGNSLIPDLPHPHITSNPPNVSLSAPQNFNMSTTESARSQASLNGQVEQKSLNELLHGQQQQQQQYQQEVEGKSSHDATSPSLESTIKTTVLSVDGANINATNSNFNGNDSTTAYCNEVSNEITKKATSLQSEYESVDKSPSKAIGQESLESKSPMSEGQNIPTGACRVCKRTQEQDPRAMVCFKGESSEKDIYLHVFCGKTAVILPTVSQPQYEILLKAGLKNKHGIGPDVNFALSRTRSAVAYGGEPDKDPKKRTEKEFYLVKEFEEHLNSIRGHGYEHNKLATAQNSLPLSPPGALSIGTSAKANSAARNFNQSISSPAPNQDSSSLSMAQPQMAHINASHGSLLASQSHYSPIQNHDPLSSASQQSTNLECPTVSPRDTTISRKRKAQGLITNEFGTSGTSQKMSIQPNSTGAVTGTIQTTPQQPFFQSLGQIASANNQLNWQDQANKKTNFDWQNYQLSTSPHPSTGVLQSSSIYPTNPIVHSYPFLNGNQNSAILTAAEDADTVKFLEGAFDNNANIPLLYSSSACLPQQLSAETGHIDDVSGVYLGHRQKTEELLVHDQFETSNIKTEYDVPQEFRSIHNEDDKDSPSEEQLLSKVMEI